MEGKLIGKVGGVFTGASSVHGGQETTAVSMMFPMLHQGMIIVGVPYSVKELFTSGSPYGPAGILGAKSDQLKDIDLVVAKAHGRRIAGDCKNYFLNYFSTGRSNILPHSYHDPRYTRNFLYPSFFNAR